ncbi:MAG: hypothetical protein IKP77_01230 [Acholeplasmatales bacterium]|nr:hypothetical protein [Acholeplasmatales bacterium]
MKKRIIKLAALVTGMLGVISLSACDEETPSNTSGTNVVNTTTTEITPTTTKTQVTPTTTSTSDSGSSTTTTTQNEDTNNQQVLPNHIWSDDWNYDDKNHWHECTIDGCELIHGVENHNFDENGVCTICGYKEEKVVVDNDSIKEILVYDHIQANNRETKLLQKLFKVGDTFNTTNLALKVKKNIDRVESIDLLSVSDTQITAPDMTSAGVKEVKISYGNKEVSYNITVLDFTGVDKEAAIVTVDSNATPKVEGNNITVNRINDAVMVFKLLGSSDNSDKVINVKAGKYFEKVEFDIPNIRLHGEDTDASKTIIEYDLFAEVRTPNSLTVGYSTDGGASVSIRKNATGFYADNITFQNYWNTNARFNESKILAESINTDKTRSAQTQAVACLVQADKAVFDNVRFSGYHDTLYSQVGRHIYTNCFIEGRTDYVFGTTATSYFKNCTLKTIGANDSKNGGYVVATMGSDNNGSTSSLIEYGYIFDECTFTADSNTLDGTVSLGRFWKDNMRMAVINSNISSAYSKTPYGSSDPKNTRYTKMSSASTVTPSQLVEYNNSGEGALSETTPGVIDNLCKIVSLGDSNNYKDFSIIFAKKNGNFEYSKAWNGTIGTLVPVSYDFTEFAERQNADSAPEGDSLFNGDITIFGKYRIEASKHIVQVQLETVIKFNKAGTVSVDWFGSGYGCQDNATITYKDGKATITIDDLAGQTGIYFSGFELDGSTPGVHEHIYGEWQYTVPTLDGTGLAYKECLDCENDPIDKVEVILPILTDDRYSVSSTIPATTTEKGEGIYTIVLEGVTYQFTGETPKLEEGQHIHVYATEWTISNPTFESKGSAVKECIATGCTNPVDKIEVELPVLSDSSYSISNNTATYEASGTGTYTYTFGTNVISFVAETPQKTIKLIEKSYSYDYASKGNNCDDYIYLEGCKDNSPYLKLTSESVIKLNVKNGSTVVIGGFFINGKWGGIAIDGINQAVPANNGSVTYVATKDGIITISLISQDGITQSALKTITVTAPIVLDTITTEGKIAFGDADHATYQSYVDNNQLENTTTITPNKATDSSVVGGKLKFKVASGAHIDIYGNYRVNYTINKESVSGLTSEIGAHKIIDCTEETTIEIVCSSNNYFYWIDITFPTE